MVFVGEVGYADIYDKLASMLCQLNAKMSYIFFVEFLHMPSWDFVCFSEKGLENWGI